MELLTNTSRCVALSDSLQQKLEKISEIYDVDYLLALKTDPVLRAQYYKVDQVPLPLFYHNPKHVEHKAQSSSKDAPLESVWYVDKYLRDVPARQVLELGSGLNGDGLFLAMKYPNINFFRITSYTSKLEHEVTAYRGLKNYRTMLGDIKELKPFEAESMDLSFSVETLSLCPERSTALSEVHRVLKSGTYFVVVDGYLGQSEGPLTKDELIVRHLVGRGRSLKEFETYDQFREEVKELGFSVEDEVDVTSHTKEVLEKYQKPAKLLFEYPIIAKPLSRMRSSDFAYTSITNYLMPDVAEAGMARYIVTILKKK